MGFNTYFRDLRKTTGLSQSSLAKELGVSITTIKNAEYGITNKPNSKFLDSLSKYLKINKIVVYRDIIFYSYFVTTNYDKMPFIDFLTLYSSYRELESCEMNLPKKITSHNDGDHILIYHYYLKNPSHNVLVFDANYFFCENNKYNKNLGSILQKIFLNKEINLTSNSDVKSVEIVFNSKIHIETEIFNSIESFNTNLLKKKVIFVLFDKDKLEVIDKKQL